jgi:hypothetical protein
MRRNRFVLKGGSAIVSEGISPVTSVVATVAVVSLHVSLVRTVSTVGSRVRRYV